MAEDSNASSLSGDTGIIKLPKVQEERKSRGRIADEAKKGPLVERLHRAELKVMTWNLADFSTGGVVQQRLWSKQDDANGSSRLTFVAETISREAPDVVFIQEVKPGPGGDNAVRELTDELNNIMDDKQPCVSTVKSHCVSLLDKIVQGDEEAKSELMKILTQNEKKYEPDVWINGKAWKMREAVKGGDTDDQSKAIQNTAWKEKSYNYICTRALKDCQNDSPVAPGAEAYGCIWNNQKFEEGPKVVYLEGVASLEKLDEALKEGLETMETSLKASLKESLEDYEERHKTFSRFPALFTFTPKHGGADVKNSDSENQKIHFLVFHLASSSQYGGTEKNKAEMEVLQSLAKWAWDEGIRLILLGDHNAGECGTEETLKKFDSPSSERSVGPFAVKPDAQTTRFPATNLFPFVKGTGTAVNLQDTEYYIKLLEQYGGVEENLRKIDPSYDRQYSGEILHYNRTKNLTRIGDKGHKNLAALKSIMIMERLNLNIPQSPTISQQITECLEQLQDEKGIDLGHYDPWQREFEGEVLRYLRYVNKDGEAKDTLKKNCSKNTEALKNIAVRKGLSDFIQYSGGKHNDNIIFPHEERWLPVTRVSKRKPFKFVHNLKFLEGRVLEIPVRELCAYSQRNQVPLGNWKYLWSDHRPVVARFSLS